MTKLIASPEGLEVANKYLECGSSIKKTAAAMAISEEKVSELLAKPEVRRYIDSVFLDLGYRNRFKLAALLDEIIGSKLVEAREAEMYTSKDLIDLIALAHKMRIDELKARKEEITQTNVQINTENAVFGSGNYGKLMAKLLGAGNADSKGE